GSSLKLLVGHDIQRACGVYSLAITRDLQEDPEEAGHPEDRVPATPSLPMDIDAEEDFQRYIEELGCAPKPSPLRSSEASVPDEPVEAADR
ncbi:hypothetical protein PIB30_100701, partial [Stylosanthes scabra]|nr:hypothetical protein [Stylosanthes scabra]